MTQLSQLSPQPLWQIFEKICSIPHPSKHEQKISAWIQSFASELRLDIKEDKVVRPLYELSLEIQVSNSYEAEINAAASAVQEIKHLYAKLHMAADRREIAR